MAELDFSLLIEAAVNARERAYAPYSKFKVGAALLGASGKIYLGCNVENASYGATICAERAAVVQAVGAGDYSFQALAVVGYSEEADATHEGYAYPCGICRQFLSEFCKPDMPIALARTTKDYRMSSLRELLPESFGPQNLE